MPYSQRISSFLHLRPLGKSWSWLLKWVLLTGAYAFLAYKLIAFNRYNELFAALKSMPFSHFGWLLAILILLPFNWLLEASKWRMLTTKIQKISLKQAIEAVLAGISTGFFTPNRVGEFAGRLFYLNPDNRKAGVTLSAVNSLTQNLVMVLCGIPACILFFCHKGNANQSGLVWFVTWIIGCVALIIFIYSSLTQISKKVASSRYADKIMPFITCLSDFSTAHLFKIMLVSLLRYVVFSIQFGFMLYFFDINLSLTEALISIPTTYLFVTFTPAFAFSEVAIRSSYAVLVIGTYSGQVAGIALAGLCIWLVNFALPMLVGSVILFRQKK